MSKNHPTKVFISYSHDSTEHKEKVTQLANELRLNYGLDAIGDFYEEDNPAGGQIPGLMEKIRTVDRVLCILTPEYKIKADEGMGGVAYEKTIITDELFHDIGSSKFIPVSFCTDVEYKDCAPNFLTSTRKALLRSAYESDDHLTEAIARTILDMPKKPKPPIGKNKLLVENTKIDVEKIDINTIISESNHRIIFETALFYAKTNDVINFRKLIKKVKKQVFFKLNSLREQHEKSFISVNEKDLYPIMDQFVEAASPLFLIAFAGYLSFKDSFHNQEGLLIDLLAIEGWSEQGGKAVFCNIPKLLAYVYHHIYGALNIDNDEIFSLSKILTQKIPTGKNQKYESLHKVRSVTGWIESLGGDCFKSFSYLLSSYQRWDWVKLLFEDEEDFQKAIVCYQTTINLLNYFMTINTDSLKADEHYITRCDVPPSSIVAGRKLKQHAQVYLIKNSGFFKEILHHYGIPIKTAIDQWARWLREICKFNTQFNFVDFWMFDEDILENILT